MQTRAPIFFDKGITFATLQRAAALVGRELQLELV
jgi:hypothetical protein